MYMIKYKGEYLFTIYLGSVQFTKSIGLAMKFKTSRDAVIYKNKHGLSGKIVRLPKFGV